MSIKPKNTFIIREPLITLFLKINLAINLFGQDISSKKN